MYKKIMIGLFALFLTVPTILTFVFLSPEAQPFSENENRYLARFPKFSFDNIKDKSFMEGFDKWISDRFIGREDWILLKNKTEATIGKTEISGVFTYDDRMIQVWKGYDEELFNQQIAAMNGFAERHKDIPIYLMLVPNAQEIYSNTLPSVAVIGNQKSYIRDVYDSLTEFDGFIDAYSSLSSHKSSYIYYRTDHHWTSYGAYLGYVEAASTLGYTPIDNGQFTIEHASNSFRGTLFSKTLDTTITPDVIDFYSLGEQEPELTLSVMQGNGSFKDYDSLYFRSYLDKKDKYSAFLGPNMPIVNIETKLENNDSSLLILKDSYAHSMIPFLTKHYSKITVVDLRHINVDFQNFISLDDYDQVLFLYNVITFSEDTDIKKLNICK